MSRYELAVERCRDALKEFSEGEDISNDPDYVDEG